MSFAEEIDRFVIKARGLCDDTVAEAVKGVAFRIDERSPVGDGRYWKNPPPKGYLGGHFRGNWQLGIDQRPTTELAGVDPDGSGLGGRVITRIPDDAAGKVYWLANNAPYAMRLEMGYSRQAPQGMVGLTVAEWQPIVAQAAETAKARRA